MPVVRKIPMRQCTGCGERKEKKQMVRVLRTDTGEITIDETGKKNGRGAYLCRNKACLERALKTKALNRSLKCEIPQEITERLREEMAGIGTESAE